MEAWQEFDDDGRMKDSSFRDRVVDVMEEFYKLLGIILAVAGDTLNSLPLTTEFQCFPQK